MHSVGAFRGLDLEPGIWAHVQGEGSETQQCPSTPLGVAPFHKGVFASRGPTGWCDGTVGPPRAPMTICGSRNSLSTLARNRGARGPISAAGVKRPESGRQMGGHKGKTKLRVAGSITVIRLGSILGSLCGPSIEHRRLHKTLEGKFRRRCSSCVVGRWPLSLHLHGKNAEWNKMANMRRHGRCNQQLSARRGCVRRTRALQGGAGVRFRFSGEQAWLRSSLQMGLCSDSAGHRS